MEANATEQQPKPNEPVFTSKAKEQFYLFVRQLIKLVTIMIVLGIVVWLSRSYSPWIVLGASIVGLILIVATGVTCIVHLVRSVIYGAKKQ